MQLKYQLLAAVVLAYLLMPACEREPVVVPGPNSTVDNGTNPSNPTDSTDTTVNTMPCDPDSVYFEQQLLPILVSNCAMSGCHSTESHRDGVVLVDYQSVRTTSGIRLNDPTDSELYEVLSDSDPEDRMPPAPRDPLSSSEKAMILAWIQQGAQNLHCDQACDTVSVSFSLHIAPLVQTQCAGCHQGNNPSGGVFLNNYTTIREQALSGQLVGTAAHLPGFQPMPPAGAGMSDCEVRQLELWVEAGAPEN